MNGRVYDPVVARFLSADPDIQTPGDLQNYNRYSYALNNPLRYTDPTGYDFWSDAGNFFSDPMNDIELISSIVVCVAAPGVGCMVIGAFYALENAYIAVQQGASFEQTAANVAIGVGVGALTSGATSALLGPGAHGIWGIIAGAASAATTTALSDVVAGRSLGPDVFWSAAIAGAQSGATLALQQSIGPSQASAQAAGRNPDNDDFAAMVRAQRAQGRICAWRPGLVWKWEARAKRGPPSLVLALKEAQVPESSGVALTG